MRAPLNTLLIRPLGFCGLFFFGVWFFEVVLQSAKCHKRGEEISNICCHTAKIRFFHPTRQLCRGQLAGNCLKAETPRTTALFTLFLCLEPQGLALRKPQKPQGCGEPSCLRRLLAAISCHQLQPAEGSRLQSLQDSGGKSRAPGGLFPEARKRHHTNVKVTYMTQSEQGFSRSSEAPDTYFLH